MAPRIPQMNKGDRPSAVPRSSAPVGTGAEPLIKGLGVLADTGVNIAADAEAREAERLRGILEAQQAITNEVSGARMAGDFEEELVGFSEGLKQQYKDAPEKVIEAFIAPARAKADAFQKGSENGQVELDFARQSGARIQAMTRELHDWVIRSKAQKAKGDLSVLANRASAGAEAQSLASLPGYLASKEAQLAPLFQSVYGSDADKKMAELKNNSVRAFIATRDDVPSILTVAAALERTEGGHPLVDNMDGDDRKAARSALTASFEGAIKKRNFNQIRDGILQNIDLAEAFQAGALDAGTVWAAKRALEMQKQAIMVGLQDEDKLLNGTVAEGRLSADAGFAPKDRKEVLELIDLRLAALDGFDMARRKQTPFDAEDDVDSVTALTVQLDKALKSKNGKDLKAVLEVQKNAIVLSGDGKLTRGTAGVFLKDVALATQKSLKNEEDVFGPDSWWAKYRDPRESGNAILTGELDKRSKLTPAQRNAIRINYLGQFTDAAGLGKSIDRGAAKNMALRAISLETGEQIPGVR